MAYTALVTKEEVVQLSGNRYQVNIRMVVNDGAEDVFNKTASAQYNSNSPNLIDVKSRLIEQLQEQWDKYAAEHGVYDAPAFDTMVGQIQTAANSYVNT